MDRISTLLVATVFASVSSAVPLEVAVGVQNQICNYTNGQVSASVIGGVPPYTYLWGGGETTSALYGIPPGTYSVTVTDFDGTQVSAQGTVVVENYAPQATWTHSYCPGQDYHIEFYPMDPLMIGEFGSWATSIGTIGEVPFPAMPGHLFLDLGQMAPGSAFDIAFWDLNGCEGSIYGTVGDPILSWPVLGVLAVEGSCSNYATGRAILSYDQPITEDSYFSIREESSGEGTFSFPYYSVNDGVMEFRYLTPGNYWIKARLGITISLIQGEGCMSDSVFISVPDLGPQCGVISGSTYMDQNSDCIDTEVNVPYAIVEIQPGSLYSGGGGSFGFHVPNGSYTLTSSGPGVVQSCPAGATVNGNTVYADIGHQATTPLDVSISLGSGAARPGFQMSYGMTVRNYSALATGAFTTTFTFDPLLSVASSTPTPTSTSPGSITWNQPELGLFGVAHYHVYLQVPPDVGLIGTALLASASVSTTNTDSDLSNNIANTSVTVTGSFDPNEKVAATSSGWSNDLYIIDEDEWIDYTLRFQNTGTDTAFNIVVTDTLPVELDPASFLIGTASHNFSWSLNGRGILRFMFPNILLPDSNVNEAASHGFVSFRIKPVLPLLPGTTIENIANIYFDFNPPVITEPSVLVAEFSTGIYRRTTSGFRAYPVPATDHVRVQWPSGTNANTAWTMYAMDGRAVLTGRTTASEEVLDIANLATGSYVLRLLTKERTHSFNLLRTTHP